MNTKISTQAKISEFFVIGISHKEADLLVRERFSLSIDKQQQVYCEALRMGLSDIMCVSTCNRVEIYGFGSSINLCTHLLTKHSHGSLEELEQCGFLKNGRKAVEHLFRVTAGLESKILGDYQITGQIRDSYKLALEMGCMGSGLMKMVETALNTAKKIKNSSNLSSGATSVATVASKLVQEKLRKIPNANILVYGLGQTGKACLLNLLGQQLHKQLAVVNRNDQKSDKLSREHQIKSYSHNRLDSALANSQIVVVATSAGNYTITRELTEKLEAAPKFFIDISVPRNVDPAIQKAGISEIIDIDKVSEILDNTFDERKRAKNTAKEIIREAIREYTLWAELFHESSSIELLRRELNAISDACRNAIDGERIEDYSQAFINTLVGRIAAYCRKHPDTQLTANQLIDELFQLNLKSEKQA